MAVRGIRVWGRGGVEPGESEVPQPFDIDVEIEIDLERSSHTDEIADTLDYRWLHGTVVDVASRSHFRLLERLAQEIARTLLHEQRVAAATVTIAKPGILAGATPSVTIRRRR